MDRKEQHAIDLRCSELIYDIADLEIAYEDNAIDDLTFQKKAAELMVDWAAQQICTYVSTKKKPVNPINLVEVIEIERKKDTFGSV